MVLEHETLSTEVQRHASHRIKKGMMWAISTNFMKYINNAPHKTLRRNRL